MLKEKLSKLNESVKELNSIDDCNKILHEHENKNMNRNKIFSIRHSYTRFPIVLLIISIIFTVTLLFSCTINGSQSSEISPNNPNGSQSTEFYERQEKLSKLYLSGSKNYLSNYIQSFDTNEDNSYQSEYTKDLLEENEKQENESVVEDIYYEVEIDYSNGSAPEKIVVKKGELVFPQVINRNGYYFLGWFVDEVRLIQAISITEDTKIYAKWGYKESVTIDGNQYDYYKDIDGAVIIGAVVADTEELIIPSQLNGLDVIGLDTKSFYGYNSNNHNITKKIVIPNTVREIEGLAISNYNYLEEIYLPSQLEALNPSALIGCPKLKHIYISGNPRYKVINDALIDVKTNTLIKGTLNSTNIPDGITVIEARAFCDYKLLKEIYIPDSVKVIKGNAFSNCDSLVKVKLPSELEIIDKSLFSDCINLEEVYIGEKALSIDELAFRGCNNLKSIIVHENNPIFYTTDCCLINKSDESLVVGFNVIDGIILIPDGVKVISHSAFYGRNSIKKVILSESVEKIEYSAFAECLNLEYVHLNDNLKSLEGFTFNNCVNLKEIIMPSTIENIGQYIFWRCESLEEITLPKNINTIPYGMFDSCENLKTVNLQSVITTIENSAFYNCNKLTYFDLTNVKTIGDDAFSWCRSLTEIDLGSVTKIGVRAFLACKGLTEVFIPKTVIEIGSCGFQDLTNAVIYCEDEEPKETWASNFHNGSYCVFGIEDILEYNGMTFKVINNNELELTKYNKDELSIIIPSELNGMKVTSIGEKAFHYNDIEEVVLPNTLVTIKRYAFGNCENLKEIVIPNNVVFIGENAFSYCTNLEKVSLNEGLETLGKNSFRNCNLTTLIIPSTVTYSGGTIFEENKYFMELVNLSKVKDSSFGTTQINNFATLDYTSGIFTIDNEFTFCFDYRNKKIVFIKYSGSNTFVELPSNVTFEYDGKTYNTYSINYEAFSYNERIVKLVLPEGVTEIEDRAFFACHNLTSLSLPYTLTKIGISVVSNNQHLFEVYNLSQLSSKDIEKSGVTYYAKEVHTDSSIPSKVVKDNNGLIYYVGGENNNYIVGYDKVEEHLILPDHINNQTYIIASYVFQNNQTIKSVYLPEGITEIQRSVFADCENIKEITIPASVVKICWYAFYSMGSLESVTFVDPTPWIVKTSSQPASYREIDVTNPKEAAISLQRNYMYDWNKVTD